MAGLVGGSWYTVVSTYQKCSKKGQLGLQGYAQGSLMHSTIIEGCQNQRDVWGCVDPCPEADSGTLRGKGEKK